MKVTKAQLIFSITIFISTILLMIPTYEYWDFNLNKSTSMFCIKNKKELKCLKGFKLIKVHSFSRI